MNINKMSRSLHYCALFFYGNPTAKLMKTDRAFNTDVTFQAGTPHRLEYENTDYRGRLSSCAYNQTARRSIAEEKQTTITWL